MENIVLQSRAPALQSLALSAFGGEPGMTIAAVRHNVEYIQEILRDLQLLGENASSSDDLARWIQYQRLRIRLFETSSDMPKGVAGWLDRYRLNVVKLEQAAEEFSRQAAAGNQFVTISKGTGPVTPVFDNQGDGIVADVWRAWMGDFHALEIFARVMYHRAASFRRQVRQALLEASHRCGG